MFEDKPISIPWRELAETVFRRRWTIAGVTVICLVSATLLSWLKPPAYLARARIVLTAQPLSGPRETAMSDRQIQAELAMLKSPALIRGVLEQYGDDGDGAGTAAGPIRRLKELASRSAERIYSRLHDAPPPSPLDQKALALAGRIEAGLVGRSNVVEVAYAGSDGEWAARFVNDLLAHHVERIARLNEQTNARSFFQQQRDLASQRWLESRENLIGFREKQDATLLAGDVGQLRIVLAQLESQQVAAETQVLELQARNRFLSGEIDRHPETVAAETRITEDPSVNTLKSRILELEILRSEFLSRYTPTSTVVHEIDRQIEEAHELLTDKEGSTLAETMTAVNPSHQAVEVDLVQTQSLLTQAEARVKALSAQRARYRGELGRLERAAAELERLENELESAKVAVESYRQMEEDARLSTALDESGIVNLGIVEKAEVPHSPEPSKRLLKILVAAFAGLVAGTGLAFLRDWLDPSVKSAAHARRLTGLPVIAEIPLR